MGSNCIFHPVGQKYKNSNQPFGYRVRQNNYASGINTVGSLRIYAVTAALYGLPLDDSRRWWALAHQSSSIPKWWAEACFTKVSIVCISLMCVGIVRLQLAGIKANPRVRNLGLTVKRQTMQKRGV